MNYISRGQIKERLFSSKEARETFILFVDLGQSHNLIGALLILSGFFFVG